MKWNKLIALLVVLLLVSCDAPQNEPASPVPQDVTIPTTAVNHAKQVSMPNRSAKRGAAFDYKNVDDIMLMRDCVSWYYNWGTAPKSAVESYQSMLKIDFYPMAWTKNFNADAIRAYKQAHPECEYILGFNEPNLKDQCNMTPAEVAAEWPRLKALADELGMKLVSPAMNYGTVAGYSDPIKWLDEFFSYIPLKESGIEAIAIHCYMNTGAAVKGYVERFYKYNKPIWMTEFCAWDGGVANMQAQMDYMSDVISYFEANPRVEKYAWFQPRMSKLVTESPYNQLLTHGDAIYFTELGELFNHLPTYDSPTVQAAELPWNMNLYTSCSLVENLKADASGLSSAPRFRPTTDTEDPGCGLMIYNLMQGQMVEYMVEALEDLSEFNLRYETSGMPIMKLQVDNGSTFMFVPDATDGWRNFKMSYPLKKGRHRVRLMLDQGFLNISTAYWK